MKHHPDCVHASGYQIACNCCCKDFYDLQKEFKDLKETIMALSISRFDWLESKEDEDEQKLFRKYYDLEKKLYKEAIDEDSWREFLWNEIKNASTSLDNEAKEYVYVVTIIDENDKIKNNVFTNLPDAEVDFEKSKVEYGGANVCLSSRKINK